MRLDVCRWFTSDLRHLPESDNETYRVGGDETVGGGRRCENTEKLKPGSEGEKVRKKKRDVKVKKMEIRNLAREEWWEGEQKKGQQDLRQMQVRVEGSKKGSVEGGEDRKAGWRWEKKESDFSI